MTLRRPSRRRRAGRRPLLVALALAVAGPALGVTVPASSQPVATITWVSAPLPASVAAGGGAGTSTEPAVSADGSVVAFTSTAANLVFPPAGGPSEVFVWDATRPIAQRVEMASVGTDGRRRAGASSRPSLSANGRFVAFQSEASFDPDDDDGGLPDVYVRDRVKGRTELVSRTPPSRFPLVEVTEPSISPDGRYVAMVVSEITQTQEPPSQVYLYDRVEQTWRLVSHRAGSAAPGRLDSRAPVVSAFGGVVAFLSTGDLTQVSDGTGRPVAAVYSWTQADDSVALVSAGREGELPRSGCGPPDITDGGALVLYACLADNLVAGDVDLAGDLFLTDRRSSTTTIVGAGADEVGGDVCGPTSPLRCDASVSISPGGHFVAFASTLSPGEPATVHVRNLAEGHRVRVPEGPGGAAVTDGSHTSPVVAAIGSRVAFVSTSALLTGGVCRPLAPACTPDVFVVDDGRICPCPPPPPPYDDPVVAAVESVPAVVRQGRVAVAVGEGFQPGATVSIELPDGPFPPPRDAIAGSDGTFRTSIVVPRGVPRGPYRFTAISGTRQASAGLLVVRPSAQPPFAQIDSG